MPRIKFLKDFDYKPLAQQTYSYKEGDISLVTQEIANKAIDAKVAEYTEFAPPPSGINATIGKFKNTRKRTNKMVAEEQEVIEPNIIE